ncbi:uncharacterized protein KY384_001051 [Bacidia gigantensis]|uniref:uncharacterized protein n=1 Tax=Bacidia gigantensis TaxID=2732470 RepID=UPI001D05B243|nr:uncharacterized protein KY384_001051 [Bacidia gigantensis]KAG8534207.1 hypothetical protein KY384_001051 [Bacidia gigantensis]
MAAVTPALRQVNSNEEKEQSAAFQISPLHIPKNKSTSDLLSSATKALQDGRVRVSFTAESAGATRSPIVAEHEHGLGMGLGLRRIRQQPASRVPSRAPTVPSSPKSPYALPTRSSSLNLGVLPARGFMTGEKPSPTLQFTEDLTRFPSESLHSFSFANQSEDALHNRQSILKRAIDFMKDRLGWGANHPGVIKAQAKVSGDAEVQSMVELLIRANVVAQNSQNNVTSQARNGPLTGPADVDGRNVFDRAFMPIGQSPEESIKGLDLDETPKIQNDAELSRPSSSQPAPSLGSEASAPEVPEPQSPSSQQIPSGRPALKRTYTDISLLDLQNQLSEALAKPYKSTHDATDHRVLSAIAVPSIHVKAQLPSVNAPAHVHGHNNRWVPAAQAIFTTEAASPWTLLAANDLACLVFGVTKAEVKKMSMLEVVRQDRRAWLEDKLRSPGSEANPKLRHVHSQSARTSPKPTSPLGGGITASLLSKPSWREQRSQTGGYKKQPKATPDNKKSNSRGVLLCGDIVPIQKRNGAVGAASLWVKEKRGGLIWVLEEIAEDVASLKLDEDADILSATGAAMAIWGQTEKLVGKGVEELIPGLPLIDGFAVDKKALEKSEDSKYYAVRNRSGVSVPVSVSMDAATRSLRVSSFPHIAGIIVLSASDLRIINSNSVFSAALFGREDPSGYKVTDLIPQFGDILDFLTDEEDVALVDGIVVPEYSFQRARALLTLREGKADAAIIFSRPAGVVARHRDGSEINIDVQMRVVRSERSASENSVIEEKTEDSDADEVVEDSELVYALWITYSRHLHSAAPPGSTTSPAFSRPLTPPHQPSPGQTNRTASPIVIDQDDIQPTNSPTTEISQKIKEAASQPISDSPPKRLMSESLATTTSNSKSPKKKKKIGDYTIIEDMGQGAYGQVKLALYAKGTGKKVVLKYVTKKRILVDTWTRDRRLGTVPLEIHVLDYLRKDGLRHPNIVEMIDFFEDDVNYYIEMVPHGLPGMDLFDYIEMRSTMYESECRNIFLQVVAALHHLHTRALVVHRDIKDENIILDGEGNVKLIDFGSAAYINNGPFDVFVGTIDYAAPEVLQGKSYRGREQDIWALGILLYTLVYKENPFYSIDEILDHELRVPWIMSETNIDLIRCMLDRDVEKRLDIEEVMAHEWCMEGGEGVRDENDGS